MVSKEQSRRDSRKQSEVCVSAYLLNCVRNRVESYEMELLLPLSMECDFLWALVCQEREGKGPEGQKPSCLSPCEHFGGSVIISYVYEDVRVRR